MSGVTPIQNHHTSNMRFHFSGCVKDGKAVCACDIPAVRFISRTTLNPGRPFYRCSISRCGFWRWESDLLNSGLIPPQVPSPPNTPEQQRSRIIDTEAVPLKPSSGGKGLLQTPAKPCSLQPPPDARQKPSMESSEEAKACRLRLIEAALNESKDDNAENLLDNSHTRMDASDASRGKARDPSISDARDEEETLIDRAEREDKPNKNDDNTHENRRTRFILSTKGDSDDEALPDSVPRLRDDLPSALPRGSDGDLPNTSLIPGRSANAGHSSPIIDTVPTIISSKESAQMKLRAIQDASGTRSNKGKARALDTRSNASELRQDEDPDAWRFLEFFNNLLAGRLSAQRSSLPVHCPREISRESGRESQSGSEAGNVPVQLSPTTSSTHRRPPAQPGHRRRSRRDLMRGHSLAHSAVTTMLTAVSTMGSQRTVLRDSVSLMEKQETVFQTALEDLTAEFDRLHWKVSTLESSLACERRDKARLQRENEELKQRLAELERLRDKMDQLASSVPPRY